MKNIFYIVAIMHVSLMNAMSPASSSSSLPASKPMARDVRKLLDRMEASSSSSVSKKDQKKEKAIHQANQLTLARAVMLECKDQQGAPGLPPDLYSIVMGYVVDGDVVTSTKTPTAHFHNKTMSSDGSCIVGKKGNRVTSFGKGGSLSRDIAYPPHLLAVSNIAGSNNGTVFTAGPKGRNLTLSYKYLVPEFDYFDLQQGEQRKKEITAVAVFRERFFGNMLRLYALDDNSLRLCDQWIHLGIATRRYIFDGHAVPAEAVAIDHTNKRIASATDTEIKLWNISNGNCLRTIGHDMGFVTSLVFSPKGYACAIASANKIQVYKSATGKLRAALDLDESKTNPIDAIAMSDERTVLSLTQDGVIKTWKLVTSCNEALDLIKQKEEYAAAHTSQCAIQ